MRVTLRLLAALALTLLVSRGLAAQSVEIAPRVGFGLEASRLHATEPSLEAALRLGISWDAWGVYGRFGALAISTGCEASLPARCSLPNDGLARAFALGVSRRVLESGAWSGWLAAGAGVLTWDGTDGFLDGEAAFSRALRQSLSLTLGLHSLFSPSLERPRDGFDDIVAERSLLVANPFVGVAVRFGGP